MQGVGNSIYSETQKLRENEEKVLKEIEEQKRELNKREEKLREIEAKLAKGDTRVLPAKTSNREGAPTHGNRNSNSHSHGMEQGSSPLQNNRRSRRHTEEYSEDEDRPKVSELIV